MLRLSLLTSRSVSCFVNYTEQLMSYSFPRANVCMQQIRAMSTSKNDHRSKYKAVIFDMGGVMLPQPQRYFKEFEERHGLPNGFIEMVIMAKGDGGSFRQLERGEINLQEFMPLFDKECSEMFGKEVNVSVVMAQLEENRHREPRPEMVDAVQCIRAQGLKTALLTNNWFYKDREAYIPIDQSLFDVVVQSCLVGVCKPNPQIYHHTLDLLDVKPSEAVFLDDIGQNLKPAAQLGIHTIKVLNPTQALSALSELLDFPLSGYFRDTVAIRRHHQFDLDKLLSYLRNVHDMSTDGPVNLRQFAHGQSNPTYLLSCGGKNYVLRKKPPGKLLPSAHAIEREFRIMTAVGNQGVPVPKCHFLCEDNTVIGTPFYLMDYVPGRLFKDPFLPDMTPEERGAIYSAVCDVLAMIHRVDIHRAGLEDFGKSGSYWTRQLNTWTRQFEASKTHEVPEMNDLIYWLRSNLPEKEARGVVHGDFRLDNLIFHPSKPEVVAVLDWELSTLGDPLADLVNCCIVYHSTPDSPLLIGFGDANLPELGIPSESEVLDMYCRRMGLPPIETWNFCLANLFFRFAAITQGIYKRALQGQASGANAEFLGLLSSQLAQKGLEFSQKRSFSTVSLSNTASQSATTMSAGHVPSTIEALSPKAQNYYQRVKDFIQKNVVPLEREWAEFHQPGNKDRWTDYPRLKQLRASAKSEGLWNMFIPLESDPEQKYGCGLTNAEYAHICELMGQYFGAPIVFNCQPPDSGNIEVLVKYGTEEQKERWLKPMLNGEIRSCFGMTEPNVASSDATNIRSSIVRDGNQYVVNGTKWWTSNALHPDCKLCIFMGKTDPKAARHVQQSMILIPMDTPGVKIKRSLYLFGYDDAPEGHAEVEFKDVRVPVSNLLLGEGRGFEIAQGRLGPGRIHHCMRLIGQAERALHLMIKRSLERETFGKKLAEHGTIQADIAKSRIEIEQTRLLVLKAAHMMDTVGNKKAVSEIAMIKVAAPNMALRVLDRSIQAHGAAGVSQDYPLAFLWTWARALRLADGPDEVHRRAIARIEIGRYMKSML